jgi:hypothetical protein
VKQFNSSVSTYRHPENGCTRIEVKNYITASIIRRGTSTEVQDIVSTIGDNGEMCPTTFTTNEKPPWQRKRFLWQGGLFIQSNSIESFYKPIFSNKFILGISAVSHRKFFIVVYNVLSSQFLFFNNQIRLNLQD